MLRDSSTRQRQDSAPGSFGFDDNGLGRRTSVTDQNGKTTSYAYDDADRLLTVTDAASNVTTFTYAAHQRFKCSAVPSGRHLALVAWGAGQVLQDTPTTASAT